MGRFVLHLHTAHLSSSRPQLILSMPAGAPWLDLYSCQILSCLFSSVGALSWKAAARMLRLPSFLQPLIEQFSGNCATELPQGENRCSRLITAGEIQRAAWGTGQEPQEGWGLGA